jgi:formate hydrogenlyase subunit 6/NADH:ubiquinone oxidoreductase subunit I
VCPVDAIYLDDTGEPFVCIHCGRCIPFCPHNCLQMVRVKGGASEGDSVAAVEA